MLIMIDENNRNSHTQIIDQMYRSRASVFGIRRGWDVSVENDREVDVYDHLDPMYLVAIDKRSGNALGSMRLLPTTGRNMTREIFAAYFDDDIDLSSPVIWECTRFCLHGRSVGEHLSHRQISRITCELLIGLCELGLQSGINQILAVIDEPMRAILRRAKWQPDIIASTEKTGELIHAGLWDVSRDVIQAMRQSSGIDGDVFGQGVIAKVA
jgi:acyl homoserine lactone synthase